MTSTKGDSAVDPRREAAFIVECIAVRGEDAARSCIALLVASER